MQLVYGFEVAVKLNMEGQNFVKKNAVRQGFEKILAKTQWEIIVAAYTITQHLLILLGLDCPSSNQNLCHVTGQ